MPSSTVLIEVRRFFSNAKDMRTLVLLIVWAISLGYMATHLKRGWVPHDEGTLGQAAERVLHGEIPHRDFDDYTGGLTFVHALAFRMLDISSASMRMVLFVFFAAWVPAVFYIASRFGSAVSAGAVTLLAVAWSVPNYPGPMPSWYNLFFATAGAAALLRFIEVGSRRWLFLAGLCGSFSFLAKIVAAYFIGGVLLFFVFREQSIALENQQTPRGWRFYRVTVVLALTIFLSLLFNMTHKIPGIGGLIFFFLPTCGLVVFLLAREFAGTGGSDRERFTTLMGMCLPFAAGIVIPLSAFIIPYLLAGAFADLARGLVAAPVRAIQSVMFDADHPPALLTIIPFILPVVLAYECRALGRAILGSVLAVFASLTLVLSDRSSVLYHFGWLSMRTATPALVLAGIAILWTTRSRQELSLLRQQQIMLLMSVAALCSLVQFPFAAPVYFFYAAPLVILLGMALFTSTPRPPQLALGTLTGFYLLFAVLRITPGFIYNVGGSYAPDAQIEQLTLPRAGGLRVEAREARMYEALIPLVREHAGGEFIYAPDTPQVYFLSGLRNPSRHYFGLTEDSLEYSWSPSTGRGQNVLQMLDRFNVNLVAIYRGPRFSGQMLPELQEALEKRYPHSAEVDWFTVRWKE
jgi:hypothetical protein